MFLLLDTLYLLALLLLSPWLIWRAIRTGRYRCGISTKFFGLGRPIETKQSGPVVWFHGVSVGEVHLLRQVVAACRRRHPDWQCVVSASTDTGLAEAWKHFTDLPVIAFPLDFSWAVARTMRHVKPDLIVLAEGELWPNFLGAARWRGIPVAVVNGRLSPRSYQRYRLLGPLSRRLLRQIHLFAVQTSEYAGYLHALGMTPGRVHVTGSVKYDGVNMDRENPRTVALRELFLVQRDQVVWVVGSTQAPEEEITLRIFLALRESHPELRLFLVPRSPDRFDAVAKILTSSEVAFVRRSELKSPTAAPVVLVDTIGELGDLWGLADLAYVGGSLDGKRGGQNMIEPAAYGSAVLFGPHVWNFREDSRRLIAEGGAIQIVDETDLRNEVSRLLASKVERIRLGAAARRLVLEQQGATARTIDLLDQLLRRQAKKHRAA